jgi:tol-pal system protein YbgF
LRLWVVIGAAGLLAGCAEFGGPIGGGDNSLNPREQRLQSIENRLEALTRKLEGGTAQGEVLTRLDAEVRSLRGEVERMRFEIDAADRRARELYGDLDKRMSRIENEGRARLSMEPRLSAPPPAPMAASQEEEAAYSTVFEQLRARKYDDSIAGFRDLLQRWPKGRYADNAWYWLGESHYAKKEFEPALQAFRTVREQFPDSPKAPDALYKTGLCQVEKKQKGEARASWQQVISEYPNSSAAGLARERLAQLK